MRLSFEREEAPEASSLPHASFPPLCLLDVRVVSGALRSLALGRIDGFFETFSLHASGERRGVRALTLFDSDALALALSRREDGPAGPTRRTRVFPFWFSHRDTEGWQRLLFPLFGSSRSGTRRSFWLLPPLFGHASDSEGAFERWDLLWPLVRFERSGRPRQSVHVRALPFLWFTKRPDSAIRAIFPLYLDIRGPQARYVHVLGVFGRHDLDGGRLRRWLVAAPLFVRTKDERDGSVRHDVLYPFGLHVDKPDRTTWRLFPLFGYERGGDRSGAHLLLAIGASRTDRSRDVWFWPLFWGRSEDEARRRSWLPLFDIRLLLGRAARGRETSFLWPVATWRSEDEGAVHRRLMPLLFWCEGPSFRTRMVWPLGGLTERDGSIRRWWLPPLFFVGRREAGGEREVGFLWPLGLWRKDATGRTARFWPLFSDRLRVLDSSTTRRTWVLWPLYHRERDERGRVTWSVLFEGARGDRAGEKAEFLLLGGVLRVRRSPSETAVSVAFLGRYERNEAGTVVRLFHLLPLRWGPARSHSGARPPERAPER